MFLWNNELTQHKKVSEYCTSPLSCGELLSYASWVLPLPFFLLLLPRASNFIRPNNSRRENCYSCHAPSPSQPALIIPLFWIFLALYSSSWTLFYLTFCSQWMSGMKHTRGFKHLEIKNELSICKLCSTQFRAHSRYLINDFSQDSRCPSIQVHPRRISLSNLLAEERTFSLIICSASIHHCMELPSQQKTHKDGSDRFQDRHWGNLPQLSNSSRACKHSKFRLYYLL